MREKRTGQRLSWQRTSLVLLALVLALALGGVAWAQEGLSLSTDYTGLTVAPGEKLSFPIELAASGGMGKVDVATTAPAGWEASLEGDGRPVHQVMVGKDSPARLTLRLQVPGAAKAGDYRVVVSARGAAGATSLSINLKVAEEKQSGAELVAQYPELQGPADATYVFRVDLTNNSAREQSYSLGGQAPAGWEVSFKPAYEDKQIASLSLEGGKSQGLDVNVKPPKQVKAGQYRIPIRAVSAAGTAETELKVNITGSYKLNLTTPSGRLNAETVAGRETAVTLKLENKGSADLKGVNLSSWQPDGWSVTFDPAQVDVIPAGESRQVTATIKPDGKAIAGDYVVSLTASAPETSADAELRVMVKTSTLWGVVALLIILLVAGGVAWVFRTYGRR